MFEGDLNKIERNAKKCRSLFSQILYFLVFLNCESRKKKYLYFSYFIKFIK